MAEWTGLEPATPCVTGRYSNQLNYHSNTIVFNVSTDVPFASARWWVWRGSNPRHSPCKGDALPTELHTQQYLTPFPNLLIKLNGAATKSRTRDPLITSQMLYQLSYSGLTLNQFSIRLNKEKWCRHQESNSGPSDYKSDALPTEL